MFRFKEVQAEYPRTIDVYYNGTLIGTTKDSARGYWHTILGHKFKGSSHPRDWVWEKAIKEWLNIKYHDCLLVSNKEKKKLSFEKGENRTSGKVYYDGVLFLEISRYPSVFFDEKYITHNDKSIYPLVNPKRTTLRSYTLDMIKLADEFTANVKQLGIFA